MWSTGPEHSLQCSRLKSSISLKRNVALQIYTPLKRTPQTKTWIEVLNIICPPQEVEVDNSILILHITCTISFMHKVKTSFAFHFYIPGWTSWIWTNVSTKRVAIWELFKMKLIIRGLRSWTPTHSATAFPGSRGSLPMIGVNRQLVTNEMV